MSRAYRIRVSETLKKVIRAKDRVSTNLELLDLLPQEEMEALLGEELLAEGFEQEEGGFVMNRDGITIRVDAATGTVTVQAEAEQELELHREQDGWVDLDMHRNSEAQAEKDIRELAQQELASEAESHEEELQREVTDKLEAHLADVQRDLAKVVNRVTAKALKQKAARMGEIKQVTEDPESGAMTIVLEV